MYPIPSVLVHTRRAQSPQRLLTLLDRIEICSQEYRRNLYWLALNCVDTKGRPNCQKSSTGGDFPIELAEGGGKG